LCQASILFYWLLFYIVSERTQLTFSQRLIKLLAVAVGIILGVGVVVGLEKWVGYITSLVLNVEGRGWSIVLPYFIPVFVFFLVILLHEGGHYVGSRLAGLRVYIFAVAWFRLERLGGGSRWRLRTDRRIDKHWGYVVALPVDFDQLRRRQAIFIGAGPLANLLTGLPALLLGLYQVEQVPLERGTISEIFFSQFWLLLGVWSLLLCAINLLPYAANTDGANLLQLWQNGPGWNRQLALLRLSSGSYQGTRPRLWDPVLLQQLLVTEGDVATDCTAYLFAYAHYLDSADMESAEEHISGALKLVKNAYPSVRRHVYCEAAYFTAIHSERKDLPQQWFDLAESIAPLRKDEGYFTRAVVAYSLEDYTTATHLLKLSLPLVEESNDVGGRQQEADRIHDLLDRINQRVTTAA